MNCSKTDFSAILPEEIEQEMKKACEISMGTEVSEIDIINIRYLCDQVSNSLNCTPYTSRRRNKDLKKNI